MKEKDPMSRVLAWTTTVGAEAVLRPLVWATGPVFEKELRVAARRRRYYLLRTVYLLLLTIVVFLVWMEASNYSNPKARALTPTVGREIVVIILSLQFLVLPVLAVVMLGGAMSEEIRSRTLGALMVTPVGSFQIVLGKLLSRLLQLGLLMAVSLPVLVAIRVTGGIDMAAIVLGLALTAVTCLWVGAVALLMSTFFRTTIIAVILTLCLLGGLLLLVVAWKGESPLAADSLGGILWYMNPYVLFVLCVEPILQARMANYFPTAIRSSVVVVFCVGYGLAMLVFTGLVLLWAARRVRKVGLKLALGEARSTSRWERFMRPRAAARGRTDALRPVTGSPVLWRERQVRFGPSRLASIILWACIAGGAAALDLGACWDSTYHGVAMAAFIGNNMALFCAGLLLTVILASPSLSAEKESRTLGLLLTTPITAAEILWAKALGAAWRTAPIWGLLIVHVTLFVLAGAVRPQILLYTIFLVASVVVFFTGAGLYFATRVKRASSAIGLSLLLALVLLLGPFVLEPWLPAWWGEFRLALLTRGGHPVVQFFDVSSWSLYSMPSRPSVQYGPMRVWGLVANSFLMTAQMTVLTAVWTGAGLLFARRAARRLRKGAA
jgi:ABC-type transport system involved in multi-copper enzyme maturation permease subunit